MNDKVFGELVFNNGWEKKLDCDFWGQESVKIRVSAYKDEEPNDNQRDAYSRFKEDIKQISRMSFKKMEEYLQIISDDIIAYLDFDQMPDDIRKIVSIIIFCLWNRVILQLFAMLCGTTMAWQCYAQKQK